MLAEKAELIVPLQESSPVYTDFEVGESLYIPTLRRLDRWGNELTTHRGRTYFPPDFPLSEWYEINRRCMRLFREE